MSRIRCIPLVRQRLTQQQQREHEAEDEVDGPKEGNDWHELVR